VKASSLFALLMGVGAFATAIAGCGSLGGPTPQAISHPPLPSNSPAASLLYADHNGTLYAYRLPLKAGAKPLRTLTEWPGAAIAPEIAVDPYGNVAIANNEKIRFFRPPITSFEPSHSYLSLTLTPAITEVGTSGADLSDIEFDPNLNLWLFNNLGAEITELRAPITKSSVAALWIGFNIPGTKTAGFSTLVQGRFDINATLYVYAESSTRARLFKDGFPYARPPSSIGLNLSQAGFVDSSQWPPQAPEAPSLLLGQYIGILRSPPPGSPPPPPVNVLGEFTLPLNPVRGLFPDAHVSTIVGALVPDPLRAAFYTLDAGDGELDEYGLPLKGQAKPKISIPCLAGPSNCSQKGEHVFLAP